MLCSILSSLIPTMSPPLPPALPRTPLLKTQTNAPHSTPLSAGVGAVAEYGNDWGYASWLSSERSLICAVS